MVSACSAMKWFEFMSTKVVWYAYMVVLLCLGLGRLVERVFSESGGFASRYLPLLVFAVFALGIYGWLHQQAIFRRWFWALVSGVCWVVLFAAIGLSAYLGLTAGDGAIPLAAALLGLAVLLTPAQLVLRNYASKSREYWHLRH